MSESIPLSDVDILQIENAQLRLELARQQLNMVVEAIANRKNGNGMGYRIDAANRCLVPIEETHAPGNANGEQAGTLGLVPSPDTEGEAL